MLRTQRPHFLALHWFAAVPSTNLVKTQVKRDGCRRVVREGASFTYRLDGLGESHPEQPEDWPQDYPFEVGLSRQLETRTRAAGLEIGRCPAKESTCKTKREDTDFVLKRL